MSSHGLSKLSAKGQSCGKFILIGEHFVVHGAPAILFPLKTLRAEVKLKATEHFNFKVMLQDIGNREGIEALMARATYAAADAFRLDIQSQPISVESNANFPVSRGFGSSAAFAVALARAFDGYRKHITNENADLDEILKATTAVERIFHGKPSGADASVILAERPIRFENGNMVRDVLNYAVDFVLVDSGDREQCSELINNVGKFRETKTEIWEKMVKDTKVLVDRCEAALKSGDANTVAECVTQSHGILSELGLTNPTIESIINYGRECGALAGKVSGAGGGGAIVFVAKLGEGDLLAGKLRSLGQSVITVEKAALEGNLR